MGLFSLVWVGGLGMDAGLSDGWMDVWMDGACWGQEEM